MEFFLIYFLYFIKGVINNKSSTMKNKKPIYIYLLIVFSLISLISCKKNYEKKDYIIKDNIAYIDVYYTGSLELSSIAAAEATKTLGYSADVIKDVVGNNSNVEKIILRISSSCKDDYGNIFVETDEVNFNSYEISEFRKYNMGEDILYKCSFFIRKVSDIWTPCGVMYPSILMY